MSFSVYGWRKSGLIVLLLVGTIAFDGRAWAATARRVGKAGPVRASSPHLLGAAPVQPVTGSQEATAEPATVASDEYMAQTLLSGNERGVINYGHHLIRSQAELEALLGQIFAGQAPPQAPRIDFSQNTLIYYSIGSKVRRDTKIYIRRGKLEHGVLHVYVEIAEPGGDCLDVSSFIAPFTIAAVPIPATEVKRAQYTVTHENYSCE